MGAEGGADKDKGYWGRVIRCPLENCCKGIAEIAPNWIPPCEDSRINELLFLCALDIG